MEGGNLTKLPNRHVRKYHDETPLYNLIYAKNKRLKIENM
jgi:hypothetical protein